MTALLPLFALLSALVAASGVAACSQADTTSSLMPPTSSTGTEVTTAAPPTSTPGEAAPADEPAASLHFALVPAVVTRVVDGDTAVMTLRGTTSERVRFIGVDTPESTIEHEPYGAEASAYTKKRLTGKRVWLQVGLEQRDRYGRLLAYVWLDEPRDTSDAELRAKQFNAQLLIEGYAQLMTIPPNVDYVDSYRVFQAEARSADRGLWALPVSSSSSAASPGGSSGASSVEYIGNRNSKKFHLATCTYVGQMNPANKVPFVTRDDAIAAGYVPCKVCQP